MSNVVIVQEEVKTVVVVGGGLGDADVSDLIEGLDELDARIGTEESARAGADSTLGNRITTETSERVAALQSVGNAITAEVTARTAAVLDLNTRKANKSELPVAGTTPGTFIAGDDASVRGAVQQVGNAAAQAQSAAEAAQAAKTAAEAAQAAVAGKASVDPNGFLVNFVRQHWSTLNLENDLKYAQDGVTDCDPGFQEAWQALGPGGLLTLNDGIAGTKKPVIPQKMNQGIRGTGAGWWLYNKGFTGPCSIKPLPGFVGSAVLLGMDEELIEDTFGVVNGYVGNCFFSDFTIDGDSRFQSGSGDPINGIEMRGEVKAWQFFRMALAQATGHNFASLGYASDRGTVWPRGGGLAFMSSWSAGFSEDVGTKWGYYFDTYTDAFLDHLLAVSNQAGGMFIKNPAQLPISNCLSVFNKGGEGYKITGSTSANVVGGGNGGVSLVNCYSDRNEKDGVMIDLYGPRSRVSIIGGDYRRDGANHVNGAQGGNEQGGGGYAAIALRGAEGRLVCPVDLIGVMTAVEDNDDNNQVWAPQRGVYANYAEDLAITGGKIWGFESSIIVTNSGGTSGTDNLTIGDSVRFRKGSPLNPQKSFPDIARGRQVTTPVITNQTWTFPSAITQFKNSNVFLMQADLRRANFAKLTSQVVAGGGNTAEIWLDYTTDLSGESGWTSLELVPLRVSAAAYRTNAAWAVVPPEAKTDVLLRVMGRNGDGSSVANFASIFLHTRP